MESGLILQSEDHVPVKSLFVHMKTENMFNHYFLMCCSFYVTRWFLNVVYVLPWSLTSPVSLVDCAVCSEDYVRTISYSCNKCSSKTSFGPAVFAIFGGLTGLLLLLSVYYMVLIERGRTTHHFVDRIKNMLAVQSLKIIIVSWQIVTQVRVLLLHPKKIIKIGWFLASQSRHV